MSPTRRALPAMLMVLGLLALILPLFMDRADAATTPAVVMPAPDFATATWSDPWDFSNADVVLDHGPTVRLDAATISGGALNFSISQPASFAPLWPGYPGSLYLGRDGMLGYNRVNAAVYTRLRMHVYASAPTVARFDWFTCNPALSSCQGLVQVSLAAGWNDVDVAMANDNRLLPGGVPWSGMIPSLRYDMIPSTTTSISVDLIRLYQPSSSSQLTWTPTASAQLWWHDGTPFTPTVSQHGGPIAGATANSGQAVVTDLSRFEAGNHFYAVHSDGTWEPVGTLDSMPRPVIDSPTQSGCGDYAGSNVGHPWTFHGTNWLAGYANMSNLGFSSSGELTATNAGPQRNDPHFWLPVASAGIDGRSYHRLTITESYDGPFSLASVAGGGTIGRFMWQSSGQTQYAQTDDIITFTGTRTIVIDLAQSPSVLTDPGLSPAQRYAFASSSRVMHVRYDPNEDPGPRTWHVYSIRLGADCTTSSTFGLTWHDNYYQPSWARIWAIASNGAGTVLGTVTEQPGTNTFNVRASALARGEYRLRVDVFTNNGTMGRATAGSHLFIT